MSSTPSSGTPKPLTAISAPINSKDSEEALWALAKLYIHQINYAPDAENHSIALMRDLGKLLVELNKLSKEDNSEEKQKLLNEFKEWIDNE